MRNFRPAIAAALPRCLNLIRRAAYSEYQNRMLYEYLMNQAPNEEHKNILTGIRNEENTHGKLLRQLYFNLAGQNLPPTGKGTFSPPSSYCDGLSRAISRKQEAIAYSQETAWYLSNINQAMRMADVAADEMRHSLLYLYLYRSNGCTG